MIDISCSTNVTKCHGGASATSQTEIKVQQTNAFVLWSFGSPYVYTLEVQLCVRQQTNDEKGGMK